MKTKTTAQDPYAQLLAVYTKRGAQAAQHKKNLLGAIGKLPLVSASFISRYHDVLMFLTAFPDDAKVLRLAQSELQRIADAVDDAYNRGRALAQRLDDTGIANSRIEYAFSEPIARWLSDSFGAAVELAWDEESAPPMLEQLGHVFLPHMEQDVLLTDHYSTGELFEMLKGQSTRSVLAWLLEQYDALALPPLARIEFFNLLDLHLRWRLSGPLASRTFIRLPKRRMTGRRQARGLETSLDKHLAKELPEPAALTPGQANHLIDVARASLCVRHRETESVTHPNPHEVLMYQLEGGIDVVIYGMAPQQRLPTESFFGLLAASNGVPIAYGGGFVYRDRLDLGLNIFSEFRGGDSAFVYAQILRTFCQVFDSTRVVVDSAQFGYGRPGGIASGAFWFYYKMGFRPIDSKLALLAEAEARRIDCNPGYRTSAATLRKFTHSDLYFLRSGRGPTTPPPAMPDIALAVSRHAATRFEGNRKAAAHAAKQRANRLLQVKGVNAWPSDEQQSYQRLSQLVALIPDLGDWPATDKRALVALMRAKGGRREIDYVQRLRKHKRFAAAIQVLAQSANAPEQ